MEIKQFRAEFDAVRTRVQKGSYCIVTEGLLSISYHEEKGELVLQAAFSEPVTRLLNCPPIVTVSSCMRAS